MPKSSQAAESKSMLFSISDQVPALSAQSFVKKKSLMMSFCTFVFPCSLCSLKSFPSNQYLRQILDWLGLQRWCRGWHFVLDTSLASVLCQMQSQQFHSPVQSHTDSPSTILAWGVVSDGSGGSWPGFLFLWWKAGRCICGYHKLACFLCICKGEKSKHF